MRTCVYSLSPPGLAGVALSCLKHLDSRSAGGKAVGSPDGPRSGAPGVHESATRMEVGGREGDLLSSRFWQERVALR